MRYSIPNLIIQLINLVLGFVVVGLILRFIFRLLGANPESDFVQFLYASTGPLLDPFRGIFTPYVIDPGNVLEFSTLIAIVIYVFIAWILAELIRYISYYSTGYRDVDRDGDVD